ncbi:MAG: ferredoxin family protein [Chthoniobacteraceae bacterium]|nr:ferredoxin family protein [Chthoniobacteraceae bacterium]
MPHLTLVYCHCAQAQATPRPAREAALRAMCASGLPMETTGDLCAAAARRAPELRRLAASGPLVIAACAPRAVHALFAGASAPLPPETRCINLRTASPGSAAETVRALPGAGTAPAAEPFEAAWKRLETPAPEPDGWTGWAPVIDAARCTGCLQCLSFCLFGVYAAEKGKVEVRSPDQCKPNCPACARVCPEEAILFPKHPAEAIHGGTPPGKAPRPQPKADLSALLGGDLYGILRARNGTRFSPDRSPEAALEERRKCLAALAREGGIPLDVLETLPPPAELLQRAAQARASAQAAREQNS